MNAGELPPDPGRNLALELVRATEAAAMAAARFMGRGDKEKVDQAAVDAMRPVLRSVAMDGIVVIGEGEKDEAPMLYNGERVGSGVPPAVDVAVDPVDGTTLDRQGPARRPGRARAGRARHDVRPRSVRLHGEAGGGPRPRRRRRLRGVGRRQPSRRIAKARGKQATDVTVAILDRPRHQDLVAEVLATGARIKFMLDGDVAGAIMAADEDSSVDLLIGIGGTPEGVIAACALKCLDGALFGRLYPRDDERAQCGARARATTSTACSRSTTSSRATTCSSPRPA